MSAANIDGKPASHAWSYELGTGPLGTGDVLKAGSLFVGNDSYSRLAVQLADNGSMYYGDYSTGDVPVVVFGGNRIDFIVNAPFTTQTVILFNDGTTVYTGLGPTGRFDYYGSIATAGVGVSPIYAATTQKAETGADAALLSYTPPATKGTYRIRFSADVSAANTATFGWTVTYKDSNGHAQAPTNVAMAILGTAGHSLTVTAAANGHYSGNLEIDIDNSATAIVVKTTFSGTSIAYNASAWIEQIA